jgi:uncharacterized protein YcbX
MQLLVYPIKSLRGVELNSAIATKHGFPYDRVFMLFKVLDEAEIDAAKRYKKMSVDSFTQMALFATEIQYPDEKSRGTIKVTFLPPVEQHKNSTALEIPLEPEVEDLTLFEVDLHGSATSAYRMPQVFSDWFSDCFDFKVVLVYLGENLRPVLFNLNPPVSTTETSWISHIRNGIFGPPARSESITFADCAPFLIVSEASNNEVSKRLPKDQPMDVKKFRPNIVVSGASEPWEEDYWAQLQFSAKNASGESVSLSLLKNCTRCVSINVDYEKGKPCTGESGQVFKLLSKDRRVDIGSKYSPVFGRYSFLSGPPGKISVGDDTAVTLRNEERTVFGMNSAATFRVTTNPFRLAIVVELGACILKCQVLWTCTEFDIMICKS